MKEFQHLRLQFKSIKHATNNFDEGNSIAKGGFGKVYRGEFYSEVLGAVKCIDRSKDQADASFWREIMMLSTYKHKNLISLIGFCDEGESRILVYEYAHNKSLDFYLHDPNLRWIQRLRICLGAAYGLEYLHNPRGSQQRVLHRDIKSANILLDKDWNAKIADFGLSKYGPANQQHTFLFSDAKGSLGYCDPMYIETMLLTKESDVYSFGVVLFEVLCSRPCVDMRYNDQRRSLPLLVKNCEQEQQKLHAIIGFNLMEQIDEYAFDTFVTLAYQCLQRDRSRRPTMELVVRKLESALEYQKKSGQTSNLRNFRWVAPAYRINAELTPSKKGWCLILVAPLLYANRFPGSFTNKPLIRSLVGKLTICDSGNLSGYPTTFVNICQRRSITCPFKGSLTKKQLVQKYTKSTSFPFVLKFNNLTYSIKVQKKLVISPSSGRRERLGDSSSGSQHLFSRSKVKLNDISGEARDSQLVVVLGANGSKISS